MRAHRLLGWILALAASAGALGFVIWGFLSAWRLGSGTPMSVHGWIALALAFVLTGVVGGGLMTLAFYSARRGYDDRAGSDDDSDTDA